MRMPRCAISIDVDPIPCYYRIHGLGAPPAAMRERIMHACVPRFAEVFERRGIRATFFIVASDLDEPSVGAGAGRSTRLIRDLSGRGHEIGNHSFSHPYDMARLPEPAVLDEIERAHALLERAAGTQVCGFRAPGYDVSATMLEQLARLGYRYDSSIFPAPGYYAAKALVMAGLFLAGRPSGAVMTDPRALIAPADPYRPDHRAPWRRGQCPVLELPVSVTPIARIPAIGTSLMLAPAWVRDLVLTTMKRRALFNFELHGIDLADADIDRIPPALVARQPDLRVPLAAKLRRLHAILDRLERDFDLVLLRDHAADAQRTH